MECPKCGEPMVSIYDEGGTVIWKCKSCGHMTLIQKDAEITPKRQNWERNEVGAKKTNDTKS